METEGFDVMVMLSILLRLIRERLPLLPMAVPFSGLVLFAAAMLAKLALFNRWIDVRYMEMTMDDVLIACGTLLLLSGWTLPLPVRARLASLAAMNVLLTLILYADLLYFRYFQDLISVPVLLQARQVGSLGGSIAALVEAKDALLFLDWPVALLLPWIMRPRGRGSRAAGSRSVRAAVCAAVCLAGFLMTALPIREARTGWAGGLFGADWWNVSIYNVVGLYGFHAYDAYRHVKRAYASVPLAAEAEAEAAGWFTRRGAARAALARDSLFGKYAGHNVIVIQVEALQSFVLGREWNGQPVTPRLNGLLRESVLVDRFHHQTAQGRTSDAEFAALCSLHPLASGSVFVRHADRDYDCLPGILKEAGYGTAAFHAYDGGFWNRNVMYGRIGFDHFFSKKHFAMDEPVGWSLGDRSFLRQSADRFRRLGQPFHAFLVTLSSHHPYHLPASADAFDAGEFEGTMFGDYLGAVHYADAALGEFVDRLKADGLWERSIVVIYGDHDNSLADWATYERFLGRPLGPAERHALLRAVPLIVHLPDGAFGGEVRTGPAGQIDIAPTILHLLGVDTGNRIMAGLPLITGAEPMPDSDGRVVAFRNGSFTDGRHFHVARPPEEGGGVCYDIRTGEPLTPGRCEIALRAAEEELAASARAVEHGLIGKWRRAGIDSTKAKTADRFG
jgi:phosphoglycerol transferase MdoB-like AlkP superfamily enzyme